MLDEKQTQETDLWNEANNPVEKSYDLFGKVVDLQIFKGAYRKGQRGAAYFDPALDQKANTFVKFYVQPLPEMDIKYPSMLDYESVVWADWGKITFPSIRELGIADGREIKEKWFRIARVQNGKTYPKSDGTTGNEYTMKFVGLYADEDACRAAYLAAGGATPNGANGHNTPAPITNEDTERATAFQFLKVIVGNAARGKETFAEAQDAVGVALAQYPTVSKFYLANSGETRKLIEEVTGLKVPEDMLPF